MKAAEHPHPTSDEASWGGHRAELALGAALVLATLAAYLPALSGGFLWDDDAHVSENPFMVGAGGLRALWTQHVFYYPLTSTTFWIGRRLWDLNPLPYHQLNIALHAINALLLWRLLTKLKIPGALLGAAIFALHPVHVQSVAWITELKNVQSGLFYLLTLLAWVAFLETGKRRMFGLALGLFALALLSKTSVVVLPFALVIIHLWLDRPVDRRWAVRWAPFFLLSFAAGALTVVFHRPHVAPDAQWLDTYPERVVIAGRAVWFYLGKLILPFNLAFVYPRWEIDAGRLASYLTWPALLLTGAIGWRWRRSWGRPFLLAMVYFVVCLLPVLGFFRMYYTRYSYVADHWQYLASMGAIAWAAGSGAWLLRADPKAAAPRRARKIARVAIGAGLVLLLGARTWDQTHIYRDQETLWTDTIAKNPTSAIAYNNLGGRHGRAGDFGRAAAVFRIGLVRNPNDIDLQSNLGAALVQLGANEEAIVLLRASLAREPKDARTLNNLGLALAAMGDADQAVDIFRRAITLRPSLIETYVNLAGVFMDRGRPDDAIRALEAGLSIDPANPILRQNLALLKMDSEREGTGQDQDREASP